ncbi:MAG: glycosyltransferase [Alphaproteobacteria bacterium]
MSSGIYDVVFAGDLGGRARSSAAEAAELRACAEAGYRTALVHMGPDRKQLSDGPTRHAPTTELVDPAAGPVYVRLLVVWDPARLTNVEAPLDRLRADRIMLVVDDLGGGPEGARSFDPGLVESTAVELFGGSLVWAPTSDASRTCLETARPSAPVLESNWAPVMEPCAPAFDRTKPVADVPVIGRHIPGEPGWQQRDHAALAIYPTDGTARVSLAEEDEKHIEEALGSIPAHWRVSRADEVDTWSFLSALDFFLGYDFETESGTLRRAVVEAASSGCVVILPPRFQPIFREVALYREPRDVLDTVRELFDDWTLFGLQSDLGRKAAARLFGPKARLATIQGLLREVEADPPTSAPPQLVPELGEQRPVAPRPTILETDIALLSDFRVSGEAAWRIANEARIQHEAGYETALVHMGDAAATDRETVHPAIEACVRDGVAKAVDPGLTLLKVRLLVIHAPQLVLETTPKTVPHVLAECVVVVADRPPGSLRPPTSPEAGAEGEDPPPDTHGYVAAEKDACFRAYFGGNVQWAAVDRRVRQALQDSGAELTLLGEDWQPSVAMARWRHRASRRRQVPVVGRASLAGPSQWPASPEDLHAVYPARDDLRVRALGYERLEETPAGPIPREWESLQVDEIDLGKFVEGLDFFVYYPGEDVDEVPIHAIIEAMSRGVVTLLPRSLRQDLGDGPVYLEPEGARTTIEKLFHDDQAYRGQAVSAAQHARRTFGAEVHRVRLERLIGEPRPFTRKSTRHTAAPRRALFVSSNGVGLGHLTRLLALARRMPATVEPVFATMSQALKIIEHHGFPAEFLPYHDYAGCDADGWNAWLELQLDEIIDYCGAAAVIYDGPHPHSGLIRAVGPRPDCRLIWIRQGMWRADQLNRPMIEQQKHFDLIVEPGDIAEERDTGVTAAYRHLVLNVPPVRLLDEEELLSREAAAEALDLDPNRPAVLIQLGAGSNRDVQALTDDVLDALSSHPEIQPVIAEWLIAPRQLDLWPGVRRIRGYPICRYYPAFDFTISAAGYNAFNELISFAVPTIFVANANPVMDDQCARADFATEQGAAFSVSEREPLQRQLQPHIEALLDDRARWQVQLNCRRIALPNGADDAVAAILEHVF